MRIFPVLEAAKAAERGDNLVVKIQAGAVVVVDASTSVPPNPMGDRPSGRPPAQPDPPPDAGPH